ncbi:hypothetical protein E2C01_084205 [Portunus trituberculatus]|uniref:Uncharacterized protein n=1 Tax=Portunus trituberculatus TaxID=210409 RepID=A0A5B7J6U4_PORTR|nr:hypothetical protein [Portunus trituberculatus]
MLAGERVEGKTGREKKEGKKDKVHERRKGRGELTGILPKCRKFFSCRDGKTYIILTLLQFDIPVACDLISRRPADIHKIINSTSVNMK